MTDSHLPIPRYNNRSVLVTELQVEERSEGNIPKPSQDSATDLDLFFIHPPAYFPAGGWLSGQALVEAVRHSGLTELYPLEVDRLRRREKFNEVCAHFRVTRLGSPAPSFFSFFYHGSLCPYLQLSLFAFARFSFKMISFVTVSIRFWLDLAILALSTLPAIIFLRCIFASSRSEFFEL
jgi:hypothetical protein